MRMVTLDEPDADFTFPHTYHVEDRLELPGSGASVVPTIYIPRPHHRTEHAGVWVTIKAFDGRVWTGVFAYGLAGISRIMSSPDPNRVLVISKGAAYLVRADDPLAAEQIPFEPVMDVRIIAEHQLVIFASFSQLSAYGPEGYRWDSGHLCSDDLKILRIDRNVIECSGYDPGGPTGTINFAVDTRTGAWVLSS